MKRVSHARASGRRISDLGTGSGSPAPLSLPKQSARAASTLASESSGRAARVASSIWITELPMRQAIVTAIALHAATTLLGCSDDGAAERGEDAGATRIVGPPDGASDAEPAIDTMQIEAGGFVFDARVAGP